MVKVKDHQTQLKIETQAAQQSSLLGTGKEGMGIMLGGLEMMAGALGCREGAHRAG